MPPPVGVRRDRKVPAPTRTPRGPTSRTFAATERSGAGKAKTSQRQRTNAKPAYAHPCCFLIRKVESFKTSATTQAQNDVPISAIGNLKKRLRNRVPAKRR